MSKVMISQKKDECFGNCMVLTNGIVELWVTVDFGPRVIYFSRVGMENIFYQDLEKKALHVPQEIYGGDICRPYGGHRLWISPEILPRCYYPDNVPVETTEIDNGMEFAAPVERYNLIQKIMRITLDEDSPFVTVEHIVKNCGVWEIELAPWAITQVAAGAREVIPVPNRKTELLPNRSLTLWDYAHMNDSRVYWGKEYIILKQDTEAGSPFKLGLNNEAGWAAVFNKGQVFLKYFTPALDGAYPDYGCCFESYTNPEMLEVETLGEITVLFPGDAVSHIEEWELYEALDVPGLDGEIDEEAIAQTLLRYM